MERLLLFVLNEKLICRQVDLVEKEFTIDKTVFNEYENNEFSGFYDWLRNYFGEIIGFRYIRFDGFKISLINILKHIPPYVNFVHQKIIEIYFYPNHEYVEDISNDQDFGTCKIYVSSDFSCAILLDSSYLTDGEFSSIHLS